MLIISIYMDKHFVKPLRERGVRVTPQRAHIWRALAESGEHLSAEEIWAKVGDALPGVELSTIYRSLAALREAGLVVESRLPEGPALFEARASLHPHLVCKSCGGISHPEPEVGHRLLEALDAGSGGFEVHDLSVVARGICAACAAGGAAGSTGSVYGDLPGNEAGESST